MKIVSLFLFFAVVFSFLSQISWKIVVVTMACDGFCTLPLREWDEELPLFELLAEAI